MGFHVRCTDSFYYPSLVLSPITSYADQIASIHRKKTSDGFSLDIPLIMLVASILKWAPCLEKSDGTVWAYRSQGCSTGSAPTMTRLSSCRPR